MPSGVYPRSPEHIEKLRIRMLGDKNPNFGKPMSPESREKLSESKKKNYFAPWKGKKLSAEHVEKMAASKRGKTLSDEHKKKIGKALSGEKCSFWKGGISNIGYPKEWNEALKKRVRERDNYRCCLCGMNKEETPVVHHVDYNKDNCTPDNLITLCRSCHSKTNGFRSNYEWILKHKLRKDNTMIEPKYDRIDDCTLKISTVVEQEITLDQLQEEKMRLQQELGSLEQQYEAQKSNILERIAIVDKALGQADTFKLETKASLEAKAAPVEEVVEEVLEAEIIK